MRRGRRPERIDVEDVDDPTPRGKPIRLATADDIRLEMARVYREAKRGRIPSTEATRLVYILGELRKAHETMVLEAQVAQLEKAYVDRLALAP